MNLDSNNKKSFDNNQSTCSYRAVDRLMSIELISKLDTENVNSVFHNLKRKDYIIAIIWQIISIILIYSPIFSIFFLYLTNMLSEVGITTTMVNKQKIEELTLKPLDYSKITFNYEKSSEFSQINMIGLENELANAVKNSFNVIKHFIHNEKTELQKILAESNNYFLLGPPGNGKTLFVKRFCYLLNTELIWLNMDPKHEYNGDIAHNISFYENYVNLYIIKSTDIKFPLTGETEKIIQKLFNTVTKSMNDFVVNVIFFKDCGNLFGSKEFINDDDLISRSMLNEFMLQISALNDNPKPLFLFASTDVKEGIEPAILRRFYNKIEFNVPDKNQIQQIITQRLNDTSNINLNELVNALENQSYFSIECYINKFQSLDWDGNVINVDTQGIEKFILNAQEK